MTPQEKKIDTIIRPSLESMGYDLILVRLTGTENRPTLQIFAECLPKTEGENFTCITVGDCQDISKTVSALLDVEDPLEGAYNLEVSSPGIDRPLVKLTDYERFKGHEAKIEAPNVCDDRKRFHGVIADTTNQSEIIIKQENGEVFEIPFENITKAKLVFTDKLLKAFQNKEI